MMRWMKVGRSVGGPLGGIWEDLSERALLSHHSDRRRRVHLFQCQEFGIYWACTVTL